jgi:Ca2+-transporting ATPase
LTTTLQAESGTSIQAGLTRAEAAGRLARDGPNTLPDPDRRSFWRILVEVLREPMFALLLAGGAVYLAIGELRESLVLLAFATLSVSIAVVQGLRSERVLEALRDLTEPQATVVREGERIRIPSAELVRGDIVAIAEGERAPADAVLRAGDEVEADESLLTGESVPVRKRLGEPSEPPRPPGGDATPFLYSGALIVRGQGLAEVIATGPRSEIGRIGGALRRLSTPPTRLSRETNRIVRVVGIAAFLVCAAVVILYGLLRGSWLGGLLAGIALGMAMLPEEFPLVLSVFMVMGAWRISREKVLTRRASAIETLGSASVLCTDKTGTLTLNRMTVARAWTRQGAVDWPAGAEVPSLARPLLEIGLLASAPHPFDPMERAFHDACRPWFTPTGGFKLQQTFGVAAGRLAVTQVWRDEPSGEIRAYVKGAPETVLALCRLEQGAAGDILAAVDAFASAGMRVLALAQGTWDHAEPPAAPEAIEFEFMGLVGLADPLRPDVPGAVAECRSAGVRVVMITGDYPATAQAIARQAGLQDGETLTGEQLRGLTDEALAQSIRKVSVFARILPEQKLRIVEALQRAGEVVAMTGDGVNDAPALKAADIGIAMGERGVAVAREASALILLDDDFGSIVKAMRLGRRIYDNLRKAMSFIVAVHVPIAGLALIPLLFGMPVFLAPAHIALLEMIIDPACSVVFEAEPEEPDVMSRPPRPADRSIFDARAISISALQGALVLVVVGGVLVWGERIGLRLDAIRTVAFMALVLSFLALVQVNRRFAGRGRRKGINRPLVWVTGAVLAILIGLLAATPLRTLLAFQAVTPLEAAVALGAGLASLMLLTLSQRLVRASPAPR